MDNMQQSFLEMMEALNKRMDEFEGELQKTPPTSNTTSSLAADFAAFKSFTAQVLRGFQQQMGVLAQNIDSIEMHSRRKILLIHGVPEEKQEDTAVLVVQVVTNKLKLSEFTSSSISRCQRMGRATNDKPRPILVKLGNISVRNQMWFAKTSLKGTNITLSEFLTRARHQAFMEARRRFGVTKCWTRDGYIHVLGPDSTRHRITSLSELHQIAPPGLLKPPPTKAPKEAAATSTKPRRAAAGSSRK